MPYSIDTSTKFIKVTYSGTLDNNDIQGVLKDSLIVGGNELNLINRIEDMRELHGIKIGFDELMDFTENLRTIQLPHAVKTAILTGNSLQYGIARMFQTILEHPQMEIKVFSHEEEACKWVSAIE
jgi:Protein of unknown function (DUF3478).